MPCRQLLLPVLYFKLRKAGPHIVSSKTPTVSVLIPTYRYARYLPEAIESVLSQSFEDFELIISDDDSNDGSAEIIRQYAQQDSRIRFELQSPNLGMVNNWNWCLSQARGEYIKYVFGDDFLNSRSAIERLVQMMRQRNDVQLAASARTVVDMQSRPVEVWDHIGQEGIHTGREIIVQTLHAYGNLIGEPSAVMFRRVEAARGFDSSFKQIVDWEFWLHLLQRGYFVYTQESLCAFRRHPQQQTEINRRTEGGMSENARLLRRYAFCLLSRTENRQRVFERLYQLRKKRGPEPVEIEWMEALRDELGSAYYSFWVRRKATQPFINARRFWRKHVMRTWPEKSPR